MKRLFFSLLIFSSSLVIAIDCTPLFNAIAEQNLKKAVEFFDDIIHLSVEESERVLSDIFDHYAKMYGPEIFDNKFLKEQFRLWKEFNVFLSADSRTFTTKIDTTLVRSSKKRHRNDNQAEIPGSIVVGGVEVLAGALACILPIPGARVFGVGLMTDGCRRVLNGVEELDKSKQHERMRKRYNMKYDCRLEPYFRRLSHTI